MTLAGIQLLSQIVAERALNSISGGLLIAGLAWLVLRVVGRQNSGTRFAVWFSALIAIATLAFIPGLPVGGHVTHVPHAEVTLPSVWAVAIFAIWILFAALAGVRLLTGLLHLRRMRKTGVELVPSRLQPELRETLAQCRAIRPVTVCTSPEVSVPTAIGFFKPMILIPEWALRDLPAEELKIILLHEFAHLRRFDDWTNLAQKFIRTIFFFHPAVWWIEKRLSLEREMACDDSVLAQTRNPQAYAECLVSLAEKSFVQRSLAMAQAAISRACEMPVRLAQILDVNRPQATRIFKPALGLITIFAGACLFILPGSPRLVTFENGIQENRFATASESIPQLSRNVVVPVTLRKAVDSTGEIGTHKVMATPAVYRPAKAVKHKGAIANAKQENLSRGAAPLPAAAKEITTAPQFLLVMQTAEFDERGSVVWSLSVWRVTLREGKSVQPAVAAKSI